MKKAYLTLTLMIFACDNQSTQTDHNSQPSQESENIGQKPRPNQNTQGEMKGGYPERSGEIIQRSILLRYNDSGEGDPDPEYSQSQLQSMNHVTINGTILCKDTDCNSQMILRIQPFFEGRPGEKRHETGGSIISRKIIERAGNYSILSPKLTQAVRMELHVDSNEDGKPTKGERFAVLERGGMMIPSETLNNMDFDVSNLTETGPRGGPANPDGPIPKQKN